MNKQELLEKIKALKPDEQCLHEYQPEEWEAFQDGFDDGKCYVELIIEQLDEPVRPPEPKPLEPEKPVVPRYVADFYESIKDDLEDGVYEFCAQFYEDESQLSNKLCWWFKSTENKPIETLVKMMLYGYKVAEYKVALKSNRFGIGVHQEDGSMKTIFTREELAKYGFNNLDEYTVTEVEDE
ncbi:MAG: DUF1642 domain-containing protein [Streptococcus lutetiensis]